MCAYTASGGRRTGDEYQDLQSAEILIDWLEHPSAYRWIRLETMKGSLDDIQAECEDETRRLLQVKFRTDPTNTWTWDDLIKQKAGSKGPLDSLIQKWKKSWADVVDEGVQIQEAALVTNCDADPAIRAHLSDEGLIDFSSLTSTLQTTISTQLGGTQEATKFFSSFQFRFKEQSYETLEESLQRRFRKLGGTTEGWGNLLSNVRLWINRQDKPAPDGTINLEDVRLAALWNFPPLIPQGFRIPEDYIAPKKWSEEVFEPRLAKANGDIVVATGSPGVGKSTYISWLVDKLREDNTPTVRHHFFLSLSDPTSERTSWYTAANAIIGQLGSRYPHLIRSVSSQNPIPGELRNYVVAAGKARGEDERLVIVLDGLDHVWRDTNSVDNLNRLLDYLLPVPDGVVLVLGTQNVSTEKLPRKLLDRCPPDQWLGIPTLDRGDVREYLVYHKDTFQLPDDKDRADYIFQQLVDSFVEASGGHPLALHYTLQAAQQNGASIRPEQIIKLRKLDPYSSIAAYYQGLWNDASGEGHKLLHLLAGFPWEWPLDGLVRCLSKDPDSTQLENARNSIRHVLGRNSSIGTTAFHESLLAFVRAQPDHQATVNLLRPLVIRWLTDDAPNYWRWRYEWLVRAQQGDTESLISSCNLDWVVKSLTEGRNRSEIARIVAQSGTAALNNGQLDAATDRGLIDSYLGELQHIDNVLPRLLWIFLHLSDSADLQVELDVLISHRSLSTAEEIGAISEVAFSQSYRDACRVFFDECAGRFNRLIEEDHDNTHARFSNLNDVLPFLIAGALNSPQDGPYQRYIEKYEDDPDWCSTRNYVKALARCCMVGSNTIAQRKELRFLANRADHVSYEAVNAIVRLAWKDGFDPAAWVQNTEARESGLFRCDQIWLRQVQCAEPAAGKEFSFSGLYDRYQGVDRAGFADRAHAYFFTALACLSEDKEVPRVIDLKPGAKNAQAFLETLKTLAVKAAQAKRSGQSVGLDWLVSCLCEIPQPDYDVADFASRLQPVHMSRILVAIALDLIELNFAASRMDSFTLETIDKIIESEWIWSQSFIDECVERRFVLRNKDAARHLLDHERESLSRSKDYLPTRAEEYATLAQFSYLHGFSEGETRDLACLAARNTMGHGYHKDLTLYDLMEGIEASPTSVNQRVSVWLKSISPVIQVIDEITDGDETSQFKAMLAELTWKRIPGQTASYVHSLQKEGEHWDVERFMTHLASSLSFETAYEQALGKTLVHEDALTKLQERADSGDENAKSVLDDRLTYSGRKRAHEGQKDRYSRSSDSSPFARNKAEPVLPEIRDYPPNRLNELTQDLNKIRDWGNDDYFAEWTRYWKDCDPDGLLESLKQYLLARGRPLETISAKEIVQLALEHTGSAWDWLVAYHIESSGWYRFSDHIDKVTWIWELVRDRYKNRWLEFVVETSRPRWSLGGGAPSWSMKRMVLFLETIGEQERIIEALDAAAFWSSGLAANMQLPAPAIEKSNFPPALCFLVDRLDCPSRMVQERAAWNIAKLLGHDELRDEMAAAMLEWHDSDELELRSCTLLMILQLAKNVFNAPLDDCLQLIRKATLVPSITLDLLLRELGSEGTDIANSLDYNKQHSGPPDPKFISINKFRKTVGAHLAPVFLDWGSRLDKKASTFLRQWQWETHNLAEARDVGFDLGAFDSRHYSNGASGPALQINDRLSLILRSSFLRALHRMLEADKLKISDARFYACRVGVLSDPVAWAVRPSQRPDWWPVHTSAEDSFDTLPVSVGQAIQQCLGSQDKHSNDVLLFASGPVGNHPHFRAHLFVKAFFQSALGPLKPTRAEIASAFRVQCRASGSRLTLSGSYNASGEVIAERIRDWLVAPLIWWFEPVSCNWLMPQRQSAGVRFPAGWLFGAPPTLQPRSNHIEIQSEGQSAARFRYWHDELLERHHYGAGPRVGTELLIDREWIQPHLDLGASLCWIATLLVSERGEYKSQFDEPKEVGHWLIGGSQFVWPDPWIPPSGVIVED